MFSDVLCMWFCRGHDDEVLDVCFDYTGQYIATAAADGKLLNPFTQSDIYISCIIDYHVH